MPTPSVLLCKENAPEITAQGIKSGTLKAQAVDSVRRRLIILTSNETGTDQ